jgi:REP element-mobilizing transposase RayT
LGDCCYHVVSRVYELRDYLGDEEKAVLLELLRRASAFSGVELLAFCLMDNQFQLVVHVPNPVKISDKELLRRLKTLYQEDAYLKLTVEYRRAKEDATGTDLEAFRTRYLRRMYDLSQFMSTVKQRFSMWYNHRNERVGTLWTGRFKSMLLPSSPNELAMRAVGTMAAYVELYPVLAGVVDGPEDYPWCENQVEDPALPE